jgi:hypothetical protein
MSLDSSLSQRISATASTAMGAVTKAFGPTKTQPAAASAADPRR